MRERGWRHPSIRFIDVEGKLFGKGIDHKKVGGRVAELAGNGLQGAGVT